MYCMLSLMQIYFTNYLFSWLCCLSYFIHSFIHFQGTQSLNPHNDYCQHFVDTGHRPQNFIRDVGECKLVCVWVCMRFCYLLETFSGIGRNTDLVGTNAPHRDQRLVQMWQNIIPGVLVGVRAMI